MNLFLDDLRMPSDVTWALLPDGPFVIVRTQQEFEKHVLEHGIPDFISFDNDLGDGCGEGQFCAKWMCEQVLDGVLEWNPAFEFVVHSKNPIAANWIENYLSQFIRFIT